MRCGGGAVPQEARVKVGCIVAAALALIVLCVVAAAGGYWYYTTTPTYAVKQIESAVRAHDAERFLTHVDLDAVLGNAFDQLVAAQREGGGPGGAWDEFGRVLGSTILKPQLVARMKRRVLDDIAAGRAPASATISSRPTFSGIERVTRHGAVAEVGLRMQDGARTYVVELRLRRRGWHWQAIEIVNLAEIVEQYRRARP